MKESDLSKLPGRYLAALRSHIDHGSEAGMEAAHELGSEALANGIETLDLARLHDEALAALMPPGGADDTRDDVTRRAELFFNEAMMPIERTHRLALEAAADLERTNDTLGQRTRDVAESRHEMQRQIAGRETAQAALDSNQKDSTHLLEESRLLEEHLRAMAQEILSTGEDNRRKMSRQLRDEIAQTLLGIHVRILSLKKVAAATNAELTGEIARTKQLVDDTVKLIDSIVREYGIQHEK